MTRATFFEIKRSICEDLVYLRTNKDIKMYNGEFDPGSGRTLAACLIHASQGESFLRKTSKLANG